MVAVPRHLRVWGSSPLTRGKHGGGASPLAGLGLIPAHAGKTTSKVVFTFASTAHPRSRGENSWRVTRFHCVLGSSPLTRGKQGLTALVIGAVRLIPAHAGKTERRYDDDHENAAHPRSRGENLFGLTLARPLKGSSPLTRGKPVPSVWWPALWWLIPAHAGKTPQSREPRTSAPAHPRSRGENEAGDEKGATFAGSSPLTRGKPPSQRTKRRQIRLIPAHAGKTRP